MASKLTRDDVLRVAELAPLELRDAEVDLFTPHLDALLDYAHQVQGIDITDGRPADVTRAGGGRRVAGDEPAASLPIADTLANAPSAREAGLFKVPKVL